MLVREDGSIAGTIGGGCVEADVWAAAKEVMSKETPRKMVFQLNNEASYEQRFKSAAHAGSFRRADSSSTRRVPVWRRAHFDGTREIRRRGGIWNRRS